MVLLKGICGREFEADEVDEELVVYPEYVCSRLCPETICATYVNYLYNATHHNDPRLEEFSGNGIRTAGLSTEDRQRDLHGEEGLYHRGCLL